MSPPGCGIASLPLLSVMQAHQRAWLPSHPIDRHGQCLQQAGLRRDGRQPDRTLLRGQVDIALESKQSAQSSKQRWREVTCHNAREFVVG